MRMRERERETPPTSTTKKGVKKKVHLGNGGIGRIGKREVIA